MERVGEVASPRQVWQTRMLLLNITPAKLYFDHLHQVAVEIGFHQDILYPDC